jgi:oxaloacetate decarboxylase beta subunit
MKKKISIIGIMAGIITTVIGFYFKYKNCFSVAIIGGADGPTSVFIAGKIGGDFSTILIVVGVVIIGIATTLLIRKKSGEEK